MRRSEIAVSAIIAPIRRPSRSRGAIRVATIDGFRGILALVVVAHHAVGIPFNLSLVAVFGFFAVSGYVLVPIWDGRYCAFLTRRFIRLWPTYVICLITGSWWMGLHDFRWQLFFIAWPTIHPYGDQAAWSLMIEAWAMLAFPVIIWARQSLIRLTAITILCIAITATVFVWAICLPVFCIGAYAAGRIEWHWGILEKPLLQWLGRISYPLYLCHWPLIVNSEWPPYVSIPMTFAVADLMSRTIEPWSIAASRWMTDLPFPRQSRDRLSWRHYPNSYE